MPYHLTTWTSLVVQWLRLCSSTAGVMGLIPGRGTKILHVKWHGQTIEFKKKRRGKQQSSLSSLCEDTVRKQLSAGQEKDLIRNQIHLHLNLELSNSQNFEQ